jgi:hypothetical protein
MNYQTKIVLLSLLKFINLTTIIIIFLAPTTMVAKASAVVLAISLIIQSYLKHMIKKKYRSRNKPASESPEYLFEWLCISWIGTLLGLFVPGFLYGHDMISLGDLKKTMNGLGLFLVFYAVFMYLRHLRGDLKNKKDELKRTTPKIGAQVKKSGHP